MPPTSPLNVPSPGSRFDISTLAKNLLSERVNILSKYIIKMSVQICQITVIFKHLSTSGVFPQTKLIQLFIKGPFYIYTMYNKQQKKYLDWICQCFGGEIYVIIHKISYMHLQSKSHLSKIAKFTWMLGGFKIFYRGCNIYLKNILNFKY